MSMCKNQNKENENKILKNPYPKSLITFHDITIISDMLYTVEKQHISVSALCKLFYCRSSQSFKNLEQKVYS